VICGGPRWGTRRYARLRSGVSSVWSFQDLAEALAAHGITARKSDGVMVVRASDVEAALAEGDRDGEDGGDPEPGS